MSTMTVGEKRIKHIDDSLQKASIVLVDIEGTTTSISFVKDTLFPYIRSNLESYLKAHWNDAEFQEDLLLLKEQAKQDEADKMDGAVLIPEDSGDSAMEAVAKNVLWQMDLDRKTKALKQLQGHIMREGYKNGKLKGHVYSDVVPALKSWAHNGQQVYIYSSGSVEAQKLLFGHSEEGDLLELFAGHFDTGVGPKVESGSYMNIVEKLGCKSEDIVFLTDVPREAKAAEEAGLKAVLVVREGNEPLTEEDQVNFPVIKSFHDFVFEVSAKRKKMSTSDEPPGIVESTANGPIKKPTGSSSSDQIKAEAVKKTEIASPESAGSGNVESCSDDIEMMDVSNNDAQETNVKTDEMEVESHTTDMTVAVEDCGTKGSEKTGPEVKTELAIDDLEVSKTESPAADMEKESLKPCSETAEEGDSKKVSEASDTKLKSAEVDAEVKCSKVEIDEKEPKGEVVSTKTEITEVDSKGVSVNGEKAKVDEVETKDTDSSTQDTKTDLEVTKNDSEGGSGHSEGNLVCTESGSAKVTSGEPETGLGDAKTSSVDEGTAKADVEADSDNAKVDFGDEKANLEETKVDTQDPNVGDSRVAENVNTEMSLVDVDSTETEERMETDSIQIENDKVVDAGDTKDTDKIDTDAMVIEVKDEITGAMETESSTKLEKKDGASIKKMDVESGETTRVKEDGENIEASAVSEESEVIKLESEVTDKTESEMTLPQASEKQSVNDPSVDLSQSQTENKSAEIAEAELHQSTVESNTKLVTTDASLEESDTKGSPKKPRPVNEMLQDVCKFLETPSKTELPTFPNLYNDTSTAKEDANTNEDIKSLGSKNEEEKGGDESKTVEDTTKENGLASTAENGNDDGISNKCPDSEGNDEVKDKEQDLKVKKLSVDSSGNSDKSKDDDATPMAAAAST